MRFVGLHWPRRTIAATAILTLRGQVLLVDTQVQSFALSFLVVTVIIALNFRSAGIVVVSLRRTRGEILQRRETPPTPTASMFPTPVQ